MSSMNERRLERFHFVMGHWEWPSGRMTGEEGNKIVDCQTSSFSWSLSHLAKLAMTNSLKRMLFKKFQFQTLQINFINNFQIEESRKWFYRRADVHRCGAWVTLASDHRTKEKYFDFKAFEWFTADNPAGFSMKTVRMGSGWQLKVANGSGRQRIAANDSKGRKWQQTVANGSE